MLVGPNSRVTVAALDSGGMVLATTTISYRPFFPIPVLTLYFDTDSSRLTPRSRQALTRFSWLMAIAGFTEVRLNGYTDRRASYSHNRRLSVRRAAAVATFLRAGMARLNVTTTYAGYSYTDPAASNATPTGRAANRRVVVSVR